MVSKFKLFSVFGVLTVGTIGSALFLGKLSGGDVDTRLVLQKISAKLNANSAYFEKYSDCSLIRVDDGDTFDFKCNSTTGESNETSFKIKNLRLAGVDTPDDHPGEKKQCYYDESKKAVEDKMNAGEKFSIRILGKDLCKDWKNGCRPVGIVINERTGKSLGQSIVSSGLGFAWTNPKFGIPEAEANGLNTAEKTAESGTIGLWKNCKITERSENLNEGNGKQAAPPKRTNFLK